jgi:hypothetical protein
VNRLTTGPGCALALADLRSVYSSTTQVAQSMTLGTVFIDLTDIAAARATTLDRLRLAYTAVTRARGAAEPGQ